jgi:hypothetical protein
MLRALFDEKWTQWVAMFTTIFAVCAAISSLRASSYSTRTQLQTTLEVNKWSYFQAKSIKQHALELQRDEFMEHKFVEKDPEAQKYISGKLADYDKNIARYDQEKAQIKAEAETLVKDQELFKHHSATFGMAVMLLQIAIMLSSVGALTKRRELWYVGLGMGACGLVYMANGFFPFF